MGKYDSVHPILVITGVDYKAEETPIKPQTTTTTALPFRTKKLKVKMPNSSAHVRAQVDAPSPSSEATSMSPRKS